MFDWVYDNLYVGDLDAIRNQQEVKDEGVTAIVRLDEGDREQYKWDKGFTVLDLGFTDAKTIPDGIIPKVTHFISEQIDKDHIVLVHCAAGISRSVTLAMAYLIEFEGMNLAEAFGTIRENRVIAYPHENLLISLIEHYDLPYNTHKVANPKFLADLMSDI